jgi:hypothetical protein
MKTQKLFITPDLASQLLQNNFNNRKIKQPVVDRYAKDIQEGRWKEDTAEMIKISKSGTILDGQHRLMAIIKANKGIWLHLATELDESIFDVLDTGSVRSAGDVFTISQVKCGFKIAAIISAYEVLKIGSLHGTSVQKNNKKTNQELLSIYLENPLFWDEVSKKSTSWYEKFGTILSTSTIGSFYAYLYENRPDLASDFFDQLTGKSNITNLTILVLKNKLFKDKVSSHKFTSQYKNALIIKTWNAFVTNKEFKLLKFDAEVETIPRFIF